MKVSKVNGRGHGFVCLALSLTLALAAGDALAQSAGSIAGVARDTTGAVLPGVTVEASSPALIEGVRVAVTDGQGNYKIIDLRPGTYAVTFTLPGFSRFRREGIALNTGFTATVNAELAVGALEETITVTGASPLVDIQNTRTQTVLTQDVLDALPINKTITGFAVVTLGAVGRVSGGYDVGGNKGENSSMMSMHGVSGWEMKKAIDGMNYNSSRHLGGGMVSIHDVNQSRHGGSRHRNGCERRERNGRRAAQLRAEGRGQSVFGIRRRQLHGREPGDGQSERRSAFAGPVVGGLRAENLRHELRLGRADQAGPRVVLCQRPAHRRAGIPAGHVLEQE